MATESNGEPSTTNYFYLSLTEGLVINGPKRNLKISQRTKILIKPKIKVLDFICNISNSSFFYPLFRTYAVESIFVHVTRYVNVFNFFN
jgi:hypothetical protein